MKIAVIIRGEPRTIKHSYRNIKWAFDDLEPIYFMDVWNKNSYLESGLPSNVDLDELFLIAEYLSASLRVHEPAVNTLPGISSPSFSMFNAWHLGKNHMIEYELKNECIFDYVISIRPDILLYRKYRTSDFNNIDNTLHTDSRIASRFNIAGGFVSDNILIGHRSIMNKMGDIVSFLPEFRSRQVLDGTHNIIHCYMNKHNIIHEIHPDRRLIVNEQFGIIRHGTFDDNHKIYKPTARDMQKMYVAKHKWLTERINEGTFKAN